MKKSIMQSEKVCYITGDTYNLQQHHIFHGTCNKKISDKYGFWCYLRADYHNQREYGVHGRDGHALNLQLKQECQRIFEQTHSREEFMKIIGRNYL